MKKWRSRVTTDGLDRAPHRAFMRAMGLDDEALAKPMIGVVSMKGEQTPCNMTHDFQVDAAKAGIAEAGGTPREFATISVSDGISMNHEGMKFSLLSRELIADSIEAVVHGLAYDALIGFGGCDKTLPGVMMGMIRCNVPSIFIYGGSALPGRFEGQDPYRAGFLRSGRRLHDRRDRRGDARRHRAQLPADHRRLRRPIHRQHHGHGFGGHGAVDAQRVDDPRRLCRARAGRAPRRAAGDADAGSGAGRCRAKSSRGRRWKTVPPSSPPPAGRPMPRCICRRSPTRPAFPLRSTMSARSLRARR